MIVVIQGLVVLFAGALEGLFRRPVAMAFLTFAPSQRPTAGPPAAPPPLAPLPAEAGPAASQPGAGIV
jgi:hypothetical protein